MLACTDSAFHKYSQDSYAQAEWTVSRLHIWTDNQKHSRRTLRSQQEEKQFLEIPTFQCVSTAKLKQTGLTEPGGITHFRVISPFTLVVLQERKRLWFRTRITLLGCFISITGGATGTERQNSVDKNWTLKQKVLILAVNSQEPCIKEVCTWYYCQVVFLWADPFCLEHSCAHVAIFECLLYVWDDDALLQACRELKIRGKWSSRTRFQAQIAQTWVGCQARDESSASLTDKKVGHHWFSEGIQGICQKKKKKKHRCFQGAGSRASYWDLQVLLLFYVHFLAQYDGL